MGEKKRARRGRGEGGVYLRSDGQWTAELSLGMDPATGRRRKKVVYGRTKKEALDKLADARAATPAAQQPASAGRQTFGELLAAWLKVRGRDWVPSTAREHTRHVELHVRPHLGAVRIDRLDRLTIEGLVTALLADDVGRPTVKKVLDNTVKPALAWAVEAGLLAYSPAEGVKAPKHEAAEIVALDAGQLRHFLKAAEADPLFALWMFSADTGCRQGEAFALAWADVDLAKGEATIRASLEEIDGKLRVKQTKTKASRRTLALTRATTRALAGLKAAQQEAGRYAPDRPVFQDADGGHLRKSNVLRRSFRPAVEKANAAEAKEAKKARREPRPIPEAFTPHGLRHTCATLLLAGGVDILTVSHRLGHAKPSTTLNVYGHAMRDNQARAVAALEGLLVGDRVPVDHKSPTKPDRKGGKGRPQTEEE